jgi:hypothetical protein
MKNLLFLFILVITVLPWTSCEEDTDYSSPQCEREYYGSVKVTNSSSKLLLVDVTWDGVASNKEKALFPGNSYTYTHVPAGDVLVWQKQNGQTTWAYDEITVHACKTFEFSWVDK